MFNSFIDVIYQIYVRSLCEPDVVEIREFPDEMLPFLSSDVQRFKIETDSGAVLLFSSSMEGMVVIQGSNEMSVMLALSIIEELIREHTEGPSDAPPTSGTVDNTSDRLNETLKYGHLSLFTIQNKIIVFRSYIFFSMFGFFLIFFLC